MVPDIFKHLTSVIIGVASGMVVSGAVFAFITVVGVVPRFAQKTRTQAHCKLYESALALGGILGTLVGIVQIQARLPLGGIIVAILSICIGIFYGSLAMSLAEVLDVIPILMRRGRVQRGIFFFVLAIA
ncbi:MAG: stage V sporulation protein AB, partial [Defluviitaleaceae bacterium]|nr:stage V sporulation protein AB [Defluviitaleaceae bacterium]